jgi:hypothetical protein
LLPDFSTPVDKEFNVALNILRSFGVSKGVNFDGYVVKAKSTYGSADAGLQETLPIPTHQRFNGFGEYSISTKQGLMR